MGTTIVDGIWQIDCRTRDKPNAYLVDDGDLAVGWGDGLRLADRLTSYDKSQAKTSARTLLKHVSEFEHACPGHGPALTDGFKTLQRAIE